MNIKSISDFIIIITSATFLFVILVNQEDNISKVVRKQFKKIKKKKENYARKFY